MKLRPALFLDRDGTIIEDAGYLDDPAGIKIIPGVPMALSRASQQGFALIVISNQSGVARGLYPLDAIYRVNDRMEKLFSLEGVNFDGIYFCPHHDRGKIPEFTRFCDCRKPSPGMLLLAAREHNISLENSFTIGDKPSDIGAGKAAGTKTVFIRGEDDEPRYGWPGSEPDYIARNLPEAIEWILENLQETPDEIRFRTP
ncbi:MAG: HAD family hydrolase [Candidatus Eremiobacteraeota bacterium]|nr:HAD family hydrolase [Candidatus Eremiobacteraeota bacterium]